MQSHEEQTLESWNKHGISHFTKSSKISGKTVLLSSLPYRKLDNVYQNYAVNLWILETSLRECQHCRQGPLDLCNICETDRREGSPVFKVLCTNVLRPSETHRSGARGPPSFDINSRVGLVLLHAGLGLTQYRDFIHSGATITLQ